MKPHTSPLNALSYDFVLLCRELTDKATEARFMGHYQRAESFECSRDMIVGVLEQHGCDQLDIAGFNKLFKP